MKRSIFGILITLVLASCQEADTLAPFSSDGCSLFLDANQISGKDWCLCCVEHDMAYWRGGTQEQRELADQLLRACVLDKTDNEILADLMYEGVRIGGSPYFKNWYRWGYGWNLERNYQALTASERGMANRMMSDYLSNTPVEVCTD